MLRLLSGVSSVVLLILITQLAYSFYFCLFNLSEVFPNSCPSLYHTIPSAIHNVSLCCGPTQRIMSTYIIICIA